MVLPSAVPLAIDSSSVDLPMPLGAAQEQVLPSFQRNFCFARNWFVPVHRFI